MKYLIVEDDLLVLKSLQMVVKDYGFDVTSFLVNHTADNHTDLVSLSATLMPEVVHLDGLNGHCFKVIEEMRKANPNAVYFILSMSDDKEFVEKARLHNVPLFDKSKTRLFYSYLDELLKSN